MNILITDDVQDQADSLAALVKALGHNAEVAYNGAEALLRIQNGALFDLIFLDMVMPVLSGPMFLRAARDTSLALPPVVILTGYDETYARLTGEAAPECVVATLRKPVDIETVQRLLAELAT